MQRGAISMAFIHQDETLFVLPSWVETWHLASLLAGISLSLCLWAIPSWTGTDKKMSESSLFAPPPSFGIVVTGMERDCCFERAMLLLISRGCCFGINVHQGHFATFVVCLMPPSIPGGEVAPRCHQKPSSPCPSNCPML